MPLLDPKERESINNRLKRREELMAGYSGRQYVSQHCRLCNYASNGLDLDEAIRRNQAHERSHPDWAEFMATQLIAEESLRSLHDHECDMQLCACKCGCRHGPFCTLVFGPLCAECAVAENRGDSGHGCYQ